ncbi:protease modulator HflC [archaeon]|jgi:modulator of FtsH protease HflC|nr:protease modulator HflC [archaeon]MBT7128786.1 protease modulator HflC [archaeon]
MKKTIAVVTVLVFVLVVGILFSGLYTVHETEQMVITRFSKLVDVVNEYGEKNDAGLHWKTPFLNTAKPFSKQILEWDGQSGQMITADKKYIHVDTFARWRIADLKKYYTVVGTRDEALSRLDDIVDPATRNAVQQASLANIVRSTNRKLSETGDFNDVELGREGVVNKILAAAQIKVAEFGIELIGFEIKRVNYIEAVRTAVYGRMSAERNQKAAEITSEGEAEYNTILGNRDRDLKEITSTAAMTAQKTRGQADANAAKIYSDSYSVDPKFYDFYKKMMVYRTSAENGLDLIMTTDSELWKMMQGLKLK